MTETQDMFNMWRLNMFNIYHFHVGPPITSTGTVLSVTRSATSVDGHVLQAQNMQSSEERKQRANGRKPMS
eukprot:3680757-Amphidinium_carterae.5